MRRLLVLFSLCAVSACQTLSLGGGGTSRTKIVSDPAGAIVTVEGFGECDTPCTIALDAPRMVTVAKTGYKPQRFQIRPGKSRVDVTLELVAPTENVETNSLPELE